MEAILLLNLGGQVLEILLHFAVDNLAQGFVRSVYRWHRHFIAAVGVLATVGQHLL